MTFPATREAMEQAGYKRTSYSRCSGCHRPMEWWLSPKQSNMPMDPMPMPDSPVVSHFATCPDADRFRKRPKK